MYEECGIITVITTINRCSTLPRQRREYAGFQDWSFHDCLLGRIHTSLRHCESYGFIHWHHIDIYCIPLYVSFRNILWSEVDLACLCNLLQALLVLVCYNMDNLSYDKHYVYPMWSVVVGWCMMGSCVVMIPLVAAVKILRTPGTFIQVNI